MKNDKIVPGDGCLPKAPDRDLTPEEEEWIKNNGGGFPTGPIQKIVFWSENRRE